MALIGLQLSGLPDAGAVYRIGAVQYRRDDGRYMVNLAGRSLLAHSTLADDLPPGRRVIVSSVSGRRYITADLGNHEASSRTTVIINA